MQDNIINFPGQTGHGAQDDQPRFTGNDDDPARTKALQILMSGMDFICIGVQPTADGADFFTAVAGSGGSLRDAEPHLLGVIGRALDREGL